MVEPGGPVRPPLYDQSLVPSGPPVVPLFVERNSRAFAMALCTHGSAFCWAERDHPIVRVVADVGTAAEPDARARAPVGDDRRLVRGEFGVVRQNIGDPTEP